MQLDTKMTPAKLFRYVIVLIGTILVECCASQVLSSEMLCRFPIVVSNKNGNTMLTVSGVSGDSSMGVYDRHRSVAMRCHIHEAQNSRKYVQWNLVE